MGRPLVDDSRTHLPALDGVRAVAILLVLVCHFAWPLEGTTLDKIVNRTLPMGWVGVDLFFVLSGFLITGILVDSRGTEGFFTRFYARRALRIFPVYYALLFVMFVLLPLLSSSLPAEYWRIRAQQRWYWTYTVNFAQVLYGHRHTYFTGHLWSLALEEQFYLLWPLLVAVCSRRWLMITCGVAVAVAISFRLGVSLRGLDDWASYALMPGRVDALAIGGAVAIAARSVRGSEMLRRLARPVGGAALAGIALIVAKTHELDAHLSPMPEIGYTLTALIAGAGMVILLSGGLPRVGALLSTAPMRAIGRYSYGMYVIHMPLLLAMGFLELRFRAVPAWHGSVLPQELLWIGLMSLLTVGCAAIVHHVLERPFLRLKERLPSRRRADAAPPVSNAHTLVT